MTDELHLLEEGGVVIFHCKFELGKTQRQFLDDCVFNGLDVASELLVSFFKLLEF